MKIKESYKYKGFLYKLQKVEELEPTEGGYRRYKAIYIYEEPSMINPYFEVLILKERKPSEAFGETEPVLAYPSAEKFGTLGWAYRVQEQADERYDKIQRSGSSGNTV